MVTLAEFKSFLGRSTNQSADDDALQMALDSAVDAVEQFTGRTFTDTTESEARIFPAGPHRTLIDDAQTVTLVESSYDAISWTTVASNLYVLEPFNSTPKMKVTGYLAANYLRVTGTWGYGTTPTAVRQATIMIANRIYNRRNTPDGIAFGGEFGPVRVSRYEDPEVVRLLEPYVRGDRLGIA